MGSRGEGLADGPRIGLGTVPLGGLYREVSEADAIAVIRMAYQRGIRLFDTAPIYGYGRSEALLGKALRGFDRDSYAVITKVGRLLRKGAPRQARALYQGIPDDIAPVFDFTEEGVRQSFEESLQRMGIDYVDAVLVHDPDNHFATAKQQALPALRRLKLEGRLGGIGVGMNQVEMLSEFVANDSVDLIIVAGRYTLLDQSADDKLLGLCQARGVRVVAGGVFNSGILANPSDDATYNYAPAGEEILAKARRIQTVCDRFGVPIPAAALQFPLLHPAVSRVLTGPRSTAELLENLAFVDFPIPTELWHSLANEGLVKLPA